MQMIADNLVFGNYFNILFSTGYIIFFQTLCLCPVFFFPIHYIFRLYIRASAFIMYIIFQNVCTSAYFISRNLYLSFSSHTSCFQTLRSYLILCFQTLRSYLFLCFQILLSYLILCFRLYVRASSLVTPGGSHEPTRFLDIPLQYRRPPRDPLRRAASTGSAGSQRVTDRCCGRWCCFTVIVIILVLGGIAAFLVYYFIFRNNPDLL